jgi:uncharacterized membrane protein HdeD (DUF308 family)
MAVMSPTIDMGAVFVGVAMALGGLRELIAAVRLRRRSPGRSELIHARFISAIVYLALAPVMFFTVQKSLWLLGGILLVFMIALGAWADSRDERPEEKPLRLFGPRDRTT